jgi:hypothetical protein
VAQALETVQQQVTGAIQDQGGQVEKLQEKVQEIVMEKVGPDSPECRRPRVLRWSWRGAVPAPARATCGVPRLASLGDPRGVAEYEFRGVDDNGRPVDVKVPVQLRRPRR